MRIAYGNEKMVKTPFVAPVVGTVAPTAASQQVVPATQTPDGTSVLQRGELQRTVTGTSHIRIRPLNTGAAIRPEQPSSSVVKKRQMLINNQEENHE